MDKNEYAVKQYFALDADWLILSAMNKEVLQNIITIAERLPTDGHALGQKDVADIISPAQWTVCYDWFNSNAKKYVLVGSNELTALGEDKKKVLMSMLCDLRSEIERKEYDRTLNNQVLTDTLKHNKTTRRIAWLSFVISVLALVLPYITKSCGNQLFPRQQCLMNDSIPASLSPFAHDNEDSRAKSSTDSFANAVSTRETCTTLTFSRQIDTVQSSTVQGAGQ